MSAALIWSPFASEDDAAKAAAALLDEGLIACANLVPVRSFYVWQGERGEARECGALFKTSEGLLDKAVARLAEIHPYETPAITGWRADAAAAATAAWLAGLE
ncbi:MAG TPA: divalent cation tolerance protein CutA [Croceibacterium sp.]|nr:divalent cation tolerance protein CutA [Croceibacterium sp.]